MPLSYAELEEKVLTALEEAQAEPRGKPNITAIAKKHGVDAQRLRRRFQGKESKSTRPPTNRKLTDAQEEAILTWIAVLDKLELSARPALIRASANQLLFEAHTSSSTRAPTVGDKWVTNFLARHPELALVKQKSQELLRMSHDRATCAQFFQKLKDVVAKHGIVAEDIWNMDEIGFRIGIGGSQWIVTLCHSHEARVASSTSRESVTCIEAVSVGGNHISPMVIVAGSQHSEAWAKNDLPSDTLIGVSDSGYSDDILALKWIKHFAAASEKLVRGKMRLLIFDGHGSHCTREFLQVCTTNNIIPFTLPPHSSHFLQPLDVSVFSAYKHWHKEAVDAATRTGCSDFNKTEFLAALNSIRRKTLKPNTIKAGFRKTGIHPFCPAVVLDTFTEEEEPLVFPSSPLTTSPEAPTTPRTIRSLKRTASTLEELTEQLSPSLHRQVQVFVRGSLVQAQAGNLAVTALAQNTAAQQERDKRKERQRKVTQSGGVLSIGLARAICEDKLVEEERRAARREWMLEKKDIRKRLTDGWNKVHAQLRRVVKKKQRVANEAVPDEASDDDHDQEAFLDDDLLFEDVFGPRE